MKLNRRGFTLVEIMIVVAIIGIIVAIAIPNFANARKISEDAICRANARELQSALYTYAASGGTGSINDLTAETIETRVCPDYLKSMPVCPVTGNYYTDENGNVMCSKHSPLDPLVPAVGSGDTPVGGVPVIEYRQ